MRSEFLLCLLAFIRRMESFPVGKKDIIRISRRFLFLCI
jgi:hypothetical protein